MAAVGKVPKTDPSQSVPNGKRGRLRTNGTGAGGVTTGNRGAANPIGYLAHLQRSVGNQAVVKLLANRAPAALQRHFVKDEVHPDNHPGHKHDVPMAAQQLDPIVAAYGLEVNLLVGRATTGESADRLKKICDVLVSFRKVVPSSGKTQERYKTIDGIVAKAKVPVDLWQAEGAKREQESVKRFEDPALNALVKLERLALDTSRHAELTVKACLSGASVTDVEKPATDASDALAGARPEHDAIVGLAATLRTEVGGSAGAKAKSEGYERAAARALDVATRMAALAARVSKSWKDAEVRKQQALTAIGRAQADVSRLEHEFQDAEDLVTHYEGYLPNLLYDVRQWRRDPTADQGALDQIVVDARVAQIVAVQDRHQIDVALDAARATLDKTTSEETDAMVEANKRAVSGAVAGGTEATAGVGEAGDLTTLRTLAGGVDGADALLLALAEPAKLIALIKALGLPKAQNWVQGNEVGPVLAAAMLDAFGEKGLRDVTAGIEAGKLVALLKALGAPRVAALVGGVGLKQMADLCGSFTPAQIEDYVGALTAPRLGQLLVHVRAAALKSLDPDLNNLSKLIDEVSGPDLASLISELGGSKAKELVEFFAPDALKAVLADLNPIAIATLAANPKELDKLLKNFSAKEIADLGLTLTQFNILLGKVNLSPTDLKTLATDITPARVRELLVAFAKPADFKALLNDLSDPGHTILNDLFTGFSAAELKTFRNTLVPSQFKEIVVTKGLRAAALTHYEADWLKKFIGAGTKTWAHVSTAKISKSSGQISGGHDEDVFKNFIAEQAPSRAPGTPRARLTNAGTPAAIYEVEYRTVDLIYGTKTLVKDLVTKQADWMKSFKEATWDAVKNQHMPKGGGTFAGSDAGGQRFSGFYKAGKDQVDTIWPLP